MYPRETGPTLHARATLIAKLAAELHGIVVRPNHQQMTTNGDHHPHHHHRHQAKSNGLLEVTVLISGEHRKRNVPGAAFRKGAGKLLANAARGFVSPVLASPAGSVHVMPSMRWASAVVSAAVL